MAEIHIKHAFVSTKPDNPDGSIVSSSEWNAPLLVTGGTHGQVLVRDGASSTGVSVVTGPSAGLGTSSYSGVSPTPPLASTSITIPTGAFIFLAVNIAAVTSGLASVTAVLRESGVDIATIRASGSGLNNGASYVVSRFAATYVYDVICTADSGTFTSLFVSIPSLYVGVL